MRRTRYDVDEMCVIRERADGHGRAEETHTLARVCVHDVHIPTQSATERGRTLEDGGVVVLWRKKSLRNSHRQISTVSYTLMYTLMYVIEEQLST